MSGLADEASSSPAQYALIRSDLVEEEECVLPHHPSISDGLNLDDQRAQVSAFRQGRHLEQLQKWDADSKILQQHPKHRVLCLVAESHRHELRRLDNSLSEGGIDSATYMTRRRDLKRAYASLTAEVERALGVRRNSLVAQCEVASSAIASFSSIFPWSSSLLCRDIDASDGKFSRLVQQKQLCSSSCGEGALVLSFGAASTVSSTKLQAVAARKMNVLVSRRSQTPAKRCYETESGDYF